MSGQELRTWAGWVTSTSPLQVARAPDDVGVHVSERPHGATYTVGDKVRVLVAGLAVIILHTIEEA